MSTRTVEITENIPEYFDVEKYRGLLFILDGGMTADHQKEKVGGIPEIVFVYNVPAEITDQQLIALMAGATTEPDNIPDFETISGLTPLRWSCTGNSTNQSSWKTVGMIIWPGSRTFGTPTKMSVIIYHSHSSGAGECRLYNPVEAEEIAKIENTDQNWSIKETTQFSNVPQNKCILEIQIRRSKNPGSVQVAAIEIQRGVE